MKRTVITIGMLLVAKVVMAQVPATTNSKILWEQPGSTQAEAQAMIHKYYFDGATTGTTNLPNKQCVPSVPPIIPPNVTCSAGLPPLTVGVHTVQVTATSPTDSTESPKSTVMSFRLAVVPATPENVRIGSMLARAPIEFFGVDGEQLLGIIMNESDPTYD